MNKTKEKIYIFCEGPSDIYMLKLMIEKAFKHENEWAIDNNVFDIIELTGLEHSSEYTPWSKVKGIARKNNLSFHGNWQGEPNRMESITALKAIVLVQNNPNKNSYDGIVLLRDCDNDQHRTKALHKVRDEFPDIKLAIGVAIHTIESWVLSITPQPIRAGKENDLKKHYGFSPFIESHKLNARSPDAKKNPKKALEEISGSIYELIEKSFRSNPTFEENHHKENGLYNFTLELRNILAPS